MQSTGTNAISTGSFTRNYCPEVKNPRLEEIANKVESSLLSEEVKV